MFTGICAATSNDHATAFAHFTIAGAYRVGWVGRVGSARVAPAGRLPFSYPKNAKTSQPPTKKTRGYCRESAVLHGIVS